MNGLHIYDIETYKAHNFDHLVRNVEIKPAANLKDPEKIAASIAQKKQELESEAGLHPTTGQIVSIACAFNDIEFVQAGLDEELILNNFLDFLRKNPDTQLLAFNNHEFDDVFLRIRFMVNRVFFPPQFRNRTIDIRKFLSGYGSFKKGKLWDYMKVIFNEEPQLSGADIAQLVEAEDWKSVRLHNLEDVYAVKRLSDLIHQLGGWLS